MSLVVWREDARDADGTVESIDLGGEEVRNFLVITDSPSDNKFVLMTWGFLPIVGSLLPGTFTYTCRRLTFRRIGRYSWGVQAEYSSRNETQAERDQRDIVNPLDRPDVVRWDTSRIIRIAEKDRSGNGIQNSADDSFDPPPEREDYMFTVTATRNYETVPAGILSYRGAVSSTACLVDGVPAAIGELRVVGIHISEQQYENEFGFRSVEMQYEFRDLTELTHTDSSVYDLLTLDQGYNEYDNGDKVRMQVKNPQFGVSADEQEFIDSPCPLNLDGNGSKLTSGPAIFRPWYLYDRASLVGLPGVTAA